MFISSLSRGSHLGPVHPAIVSIRYVENIVSEEDTSVAAQMNRRITDARLYAPNEVAFIIGLETATVQRKCSQGKIVATKVGTMWRITGAEISRYLREGEKK
jgi:excisionase family DNA binding protein